MRLAPPACQASFDNGKLDFGKANLRDFPADGYFDKFTTLRTNLTVSCPAKRAVSFTVQDMKAGTQLDSTRARSLLQGFIGGTVDAANEFGLGTVNIDGTDVKLGSYAIMISDTTTIDGDASMYRMGLTSGASIWTADGMLRPTREFSAGTRAGGLTGELTPAAGETFVFPLTAAAILNTPSDLQIAQDVSLDGQLVFSVRYP